MVHKVNEFNGMDAIGWWMDGMNISPGGVRYGAPYGAHGAMTMAIGRPASNVEAGRSYGVIGPTLQALSIVNHLR